MSRGGGLALLIVVASALVILFAGVLRHSNYTPDGIAYARYALRDAGRSERDATLQARAFYEQTPLMQSPRYRDLVELDPSVAFERSKIFANRVLYPATSAIFIPAQGVRALFTVSAIAYVGFALAVYWLLLALGRTWSALILTVIVLLLPMTREAAASDLTDMLAAAFWTAWLAGLMHAMMRGRSVAMLGVLALSSVLLVLTRPAPYLPLIPAFVAALLRGMWPEFTATCSCVVAYAIDAAVFHAFGIREQLQWIYTHQARASTQTFGQWYRSALIDTIKYSIAFLFRAAYPLVALIVAFVMLVRRTARDEVLVLLAAFVACFIVVPVNPVPAQIPRVAGLPLIPIAVAILQAASSLLPDLRPNRRFEHAR